MPETQPHAQSGREEKPVIFLTEGQKNWRKK